MTEACHWVGAGFDVVLPDDEGMGEFPLDCLDWGYGAWWHEDIGVETAVGGGADNCWPLPVGLGHTRS